MEDNLLFRLNFILQDSAATTLDANLVKFVENILVQEQESVPIEEIHKRILEEYQLEFSVEEIAIAIKKKGKNILEDNKKYTLRPEYRNTLRERPSITEELKKYVNAAITDLNLDVSEERLSALIEEYLYYCFNSNKETLLSLINHENVEKIKFKGFDNQDIKLINMFLQWENAAKNECIYKIISYCYIYCSLTVKKDNLLSAKLFRGKNFILDANIIFRLAGINNDSRKLTISSFAKKSKELGVELCYTSETMEEVYRVITNKTKWIMNLTGGTEPLDLSEYEENENDFYKLYCNWCADSSNMFDDYQGFQSYLLKLVNEVIDELTLVSTDNYELTDNTGFKNYFSSLEEYKANHTVKKQSKASLKADVNNVMYVLKLRNKQTSDLWSTKEFFISADQNLISWSSDVHSGVPIVVLPSVWLTIMLRFSGRHTSENDYKAFCSFLELRQHTTPSDIDVYSLVEKMSSRVNSNEIKKKIVNEVFSNKADYQLENESGYDGVIEKAFDKIILGYEAAEREMVEKLRDAESRSEDAEERTKIQKRLDDEERAQTLATTDVEKRFKMATFLKKAKYPVGFIILVGLIAVFIMTYCRNWFLYDVIVCLSKNSEITTSEIIEVLALIAVGIGALAFFANVAIEALNKEERKIKYREKRIKYYKDLFSKSYGE